MKSSLTPAELQQVMNLFHTYKVSDEVVALLSFLATLFFILFLMLTVLCKLELRTGNLKLKMTFCFGVCNYDQTQAGKLARDARDDFFKQLRVVVGDEMLLSTIQEIRASE